MTVPRRAPLVLLALLCAGVLLVTPLQAGFALRTHLSCDLLSGWSAWLAGVANLRHLVAYALLAVIAVWGFGPSRAWHAAGAVLLVSAAVELEQMVFADGHCRLRDMLPNILAVVIGAAFALLLARAASRRTV